MAAVLAAIVALSMLTTSAFVAITIAAPHNRVEAGINSLAKVYGAGIMSGTSTTAFSPQSDYTIERPIVTMVRMADYMG